MAPQRYTQLSPKPQPHHHSQGKRVLSFDEVDAPGKREDVREVDRAISMAIPNSKFTKRLFRDNSGAEITLNRTGLAPARKNCRQIVNTYGFRYDITQ